MTLPANDPVGSARGIQAADEIARLRGAYATIDTILGLDNDLTSAVAPDVSGWPALHHVAHVALANELSLRNVKSLHARKGMLIQADGVPLPEAESLLRGGSLPRGVAQAPRMVTPPVALDRGLLEEWLADNLRDVGELETIVGELAAAPGRIPHQLLGPLDATQWLRFAAVHTAHHLEIADEVLAAVRRA